MATWLDKLFRAGGVADIILTGDRTLDEDTTLSARLLVLTGTLVEDATLTLPAVAGLDLVVRNTTACAVTCKGSSGAGVVVRPGDVRPIICDDTGSYVEALPTAAYAWASFVGSHDTSVSTRVGLLQPDAAPTPKNIELDGGALTVSVAGTYSLRLTGDVYYAGDPVFARIRVNETDVIQATHENSGSVRHGIAAEVLVDLVAGDVVDVEVEADAGATISIRADLVVHRIA